MNFRTLWKILRNSVQEFIGDKALRLAAALAYYAVFSIAPLVVISVAVAGMVFGEEAVRGQLQEELRYNLGNAGAGAVQDLVARVRRPDTSTILSLGGVVMLLFGAGGVFGQLQDALNEVWGVEPEPGRGLLRAIRDRFISFTMVLGTGFLLLVSMVISTTLAALSRYTGEVVSLPSGIWAVASEIVSFVAVTFLFAAIFKVLPDAQVRWRHVWVGSAFTSALFLAGKGGLAWYLGREATASAYGAAGALVLVLLWVYYSSIILLFGAEFTQVWANIRGTGIEPARGARKAANY